MKKYFGLLLLIIEVMGNVKAQTKDTIQLREVNVFGIPLSRYSSGTKVDQIQNGNENSLLYKALADETTAYFKTYGNGQLSTIAFRGTSASHTAVIWNGININSPSLGQTDFSLLPTFLMEDIAVQYGTASSLFGSDALGGSVILAQQTPKFERESRLQIHQQLGSFGRSFSGTKAVYGNGKLEFRTKAFYSTIRNDFPYRSPALGYTKKQNDASVINYGFDQQVHYRISERQWLSLEGMYTYNFRNIQPTVTNDQGGGTLRDENSRLSLSYQDNSRIGRLYASAGYIANKEVYNVDDTNWTNQLNFLVNVETPIASKTNLRYGINAALYSARNANFPTPVSEQRYDGFVSLRQQLAPKWSASINLRQSVYAHRKAPFAPSVGTEFKLIDGGPQTLLLRAQISRGYRVPTLNDRFWVPGGNPNLKPEDAFHIEGGFAWTYHRDTRELKLDVTSFKTKVSQWIIWLPGSNGIWTPSNLQDVNAYGLEIASKYTFGDSPHSVRIGANYGYTRSINEKGLNDFDKTTVGKQLPYVPVSIASAFVKKGFKAWQVQLRASATGLRYVTLDNIENESLAAYALFDAALMKDMSWHSTKFNVRAEVNNILNTYYENVKSNAMPGRNYSIHITLNFKTKSS